MQFTHRSPAGADAAKLAKPPRRGSQMGLSLLLFRMVVGGDAKRWCCTMTEPNEKHRLRDVKKVVTAHLSLRFDFRLALFHPVDFSSRLFFLLSLSFHSAIPWPLRPSFSSLLIQISTLALEIDIPPPLFTLTLDRRSDSV